jgi:class 3 adenylate cyclase
VKGQIAREIPNDYDEYYLRILRICLKYACPISAALFLGYFLWDCLFAPSGEAAFRTFVLRLAFAIAVFTFGLLVPRINSLRVIMGGVSVLYVFCLLDLIAILSLIPRGLVVGVPGLLLIIMLAGGTFCLRPLPSTICGVIGIGGLVLASYVAGLTYQEIASGAVFFASALLVSGGFLVLLDRELRQKHATEKSLEHEKEQSERLLKEILPRYVIQRIREGADVIAESVSEVNVIFIDIVGFTAMSRKLAPGHLIEVLGEIFRYFDDKCEKYGVTKIKTIGDAYMAATGAPEPSSLSSTAAVEFCLDAIGSVDTIAHRTGIPIRVRVGIATGAVISGVLSLKRPAYDLWGETVNLASRMESSSEPGRVQIAETTYWRVKDKFVCEPRSLVDVKGVGPTQTYFVRAPLEL